MEVKMEKKRRVKIEYPGISGNIKAIAFKDDDKTIILLSGDPEGLLSLAKLLTVLAKVDQTKLTGLPDYGAAERVHLHPNHHLSADSIELIVGRLDFKAGELDESFAPRKKHVNSPITHYW
jgi:hypothetical protein